MNKKSLELLKEEIAKEQSFIDACENRLVEGLTSEEEKQIDEELHTHCIKKSSLFVEAVNCIREEYKEHNLTFCEATDILNNRTLEEVLEDRVCESN